MAEPNPYFDKSEAEIERQLELLLQAKEARGAALDVAAATALKWAINHLRGNSKDKPNGKLGEALGAVPAQALPKESLLGRPAGFSETQVDAIKKATIAAIEQAAKKF